jgi:hypothetical protein
MSARRLPRLEFGCSQIQGLEDPSAHRRLERESGSASDRGADEPETDVTVGEELTRTDREPRGLLIGDPLQPVVTLAELF